MAIKEKSIFTKHEYEYESPDGDKYSITYVEHQGRKYIEMARQKEDGTLEDKIVWDVAMFKDVSEMLMKIEYGKSGPPAPRGLAMPNITDHRFGRADIIERSVNDSMQRFDSSVAPIESFDTGAEKEAWQKNATGLDQQIAATPADDTPEDIAIADKPEEQLTSWQKDAIRRQTGGVSKDPSKIIRRTIDAGDLM